MDWHAFVRTHLSDITGDPVRDEDIVEELAQHLALRADERRAAGATTAEAIEEARRELRAHPQLARRLRDADAPRASALTAPPEYPSPALAGLVHDVRYAARLLLRHRTFAVAAVLTLAIGIGANTAVFTVVNSVLLKPLPYPNPDELVAIWHTAPGAPGLAAVSGDLRLSASMYFTYAEQNRTFRDLGVWFPTNATVTGRAEPEEVRALLVTDGMLQALAVPPALGRWLSKADQQPSGARTVMIGHGYWQRRFGGAPDIIGRGLIVDSRPSRDRRRDARRLRHRQHDPRRDRAARLQSRDADSARLRLSGVGRLKPGVTIAQASHDIARLVPIWMSSWPMRPASVHASTSSGASRPRSVRSRMMWSARWDACCGC